MPFEEGADVYAVSSDETGVIHKVKGAQLYDVKYDSDGSYHEHHELDLRPVPWRGRIIHEGYYDIVVTRREGDVRKRDKQPYRLDGRRL